MSEQPLFEVRGLKKHFPVKGGWVRGGGDTLKAVDDVSFDVRRGETLGVVGESGCGKSTLGRTLIRLLEPTSGEVRFDGKDLAKVTEGELKPLRQRFQMIFQDPHSSLNPRMSVRRILEEPMVAHRVPRGERRNRVRELLDAVGLPADAAQRYPHEFSGGQRQRIGIARALALNPDFVIADEPVAALDVSIQAQIINLMMNLQKEFDLTYMFIAHDLSVVEYISDRVAVMYLGKLVELSDRDTLYREPLHPYTQILLKAIPVPDPERSRDRVILKGEVPDPVHPPRGCRFHTRCPFAEDRCRREEPPFREIRRGHYSACHFAETFIGNYEKMRAGNKDA